MERKKKREGQRELVSERTSEKQTESKRKRKMDITRRSESVTVRAKDVCGNENDH